MLQWTEVFSKTPLEGWNYHLPTNYKLNQSQLHGQLKKLRKEPEKLRTYDDIIQEQIREGIVEKEDRSSPFEQVHYLPHHPVLRKNAVTTKMRIVFNASAKARKRALSLIDCLHTGPSLAPLLFDVLSHLIEHQVILIGDIKKAFLQIEVDEADRDSLRFLWVKDPFSEASTEDTLRFA